MISKLWTVQDVSEYLGVPVKTLYQWRVAGYGPEARRVGRHLRYREQDVVEWFENLTTRSA
jgi:excisionase family DNA binding protein